MNVILGNELKTLWHCGEERAELGVVTQLNFDPDQTHRVSQPTLVSRPELPRWPINSNIFNLSPGWNMLCCSGEQLTLCQLITWDWYWWPATHPGVSGDHTCDQSVPWSQYWDITWSYDNQCCCKTVDKSEWEQDVTDNDAAADVTKNIVRDESVSMVTPALGRVPGHTAINTYKWFTSPQ